MKEKINNNKKYFYAGFTIFVVLAALILLFFCLYRWSYILDSLKFLINIIMPFIFGLVIAYLINPMVRFFDKKIYRKLLKKVKTKKDINKLSRTLSLFTSTLIFIGCIVTIFSFFIPELLKSFDMFLENANVYMDNSKELLTNVFGKSVTIKNFINNNFDNLSTTFINALSDGLFNEIMHSVGTGIFGMLKFFYNLIIGYIIAIYILFDKEKFVGQITKTLYALFDDDTITMILDNVKYTDKVFSDFFSAKLLDSLIIGILCFLIMIFLRIPYAMIIALIVGVTNIIPYFGPFIGAIPSALLILLVAPNKFITFIIFIIILQQIDGNIIGPKILGGKTGLSSFWVLFSLLIFGGLFGAVGMIIGVPIFSIIYSFINGLLKKKLAKKQLPLDSIKYRRKKED